MQTDKKFKVRVNLLATNSKKSYTQEFFPLEFLCPKLGVHCIHECVLYTDNYNLLMQIFLKFLPKVDFKKAIEMSCIFSLQILATSMHMSHRFFVKILFLLPTVEHCSVKILQKKT